MHGREALPEAEQVQEDRVPGTGDMFRERASVPVDVPCSGFSTEEQGQRLHRGKCCRGSAPDFSQGLTLPPGALPAEGGVGLVRLIHTLNGPFSPGH